MTIPNSIRQTIGYAPLVPIWRLSYASSSTWAAPRSLTNAWNTQQPEGGAATFTMSESSAPSRMLQIDWERYVTETGYERADPFGLWNIGVRYMLEVGYRDPATGTEYVEDMGKLWRSQESTSGLAGSTTLASSEVLAGDKIDMGTLGNPSQPYLWPSSYNTSPPAYSTFLADAIRACYPVQGKWRDTFSLLNYGSAAFHPTTQADFGAGVGVNVWAMVSGLAQAINLRLYPNDDDVWNMRALARAGGTPVATLSDHPEHGNTIGAIASTRAARQELLGLRVIHEWTDAAGVGRRAQGFAGNFLGGHGVAPAAIETRSEPASTAKVTSYASSRLAALNSTSTTYQMTAPVMPWIRPADTISIQQGNADHIPVIVSNIEIDLETGTMQITARKAS